MEWRLITDDGVSASFGLAADEALAHRVGLHRSTPVLRLYTYRSHCALVGRFQNVANEIHEAFCHAQGIAINRRPTGGGAILMGADQLGVALIVRGRGQEVYARARELMGHFAAGLLHGFRQLGLEAGFRHKNDIEVNGKKLVGLGIYRATGGGLLFHASVLVDLDIALMLRVLKTPFEKIADKAIETVAERITTIRRECKSSIGVDEVRAVVANGFATVFDVHLVPATFTDEELTAIAELETQKYRREAWIYQTPAVVDSNGSAKLKTEAGLIDVSVTMAGPTIKAVFIGGDFFAAESAVAELEAALRWHSGQPDNIAATVRQVFQNRPYDFNGIRPESMVEAITRAVSQARLAESSGQTASYGCFVNPGGHHA
jgi:lipoate-protein ligase A